MTPSVGALSGRRVIVTRPAGQAASLCSTLAERGAEVLALPAIEIQPVANGEAAQGALAAIAPEDWVIFVSRNAVEQALALWPLPRWPAGLRTAAVGKGTAAALAACGLGVSWVPDAGFDSEALLALPAFAHPVGQRVWIVRGVGGRALLGQTLAERGARVEFIEVYRRACPEQCLPDTVFSDPPPLILISSPEALDNLLALCRSDAQREGLLNSELIVINERTAQRARRLGFTRPPRLAGGPDDAAFLDALLQGEPHER